ncbi:Uncharacterized protein Fot_36456 [Forsythia ovata]|uniref:Uncharacterized protein n=1 Tax=Forsythia ovata TaxID=205694 RepID=A0ABD1SPH5_9LAMI
MTSMQKTYYDRKLECKDIILGHGMTRSKGSRKERTSEEGNFKVVDFKGFQLNLPPMMSMSGMRVLRPVPWLGLIGNGGVQSVTACKEAQHAHIFIHKGSIKQLEWILLCFYRTVV